MLRCCQEMAGREARDNTSPVAQNPGLESLCHQPYGYSVAASSLLLSIRWPIPIFGDRLYGGQMNLNINSSAIEFLLVSICSMSMRKAPYYPGNKKQIQFNVRIKSQLSRFSSDSFPTRPFLLHSTCTPYPSKEKPIKHIHLNTIAPIMFTIKSKVQA